MFLNNVTSCTCKGWQRQCEHHIVIPSFIWTSISVVKSCLCSMITWSPWTVVLWWDMHLQICLELIQMNLWLATTNQNWVVNWKKRGGFPVRSLTPAGQNALAFSVCKGKEKWLSAVKPPGSPNAADSRPLCAQLSALQHPSCLWPQAEPLPDCWGRC